MKIVAILQARLGSTRLPNKVLLPLAGKPMVQHIIERVQRATLLDDIVLAVPVKDYASFEPITRATQCLLYAYHGDESDLVCRYLRAAQHTDADVIVRIPCDNPCVDPDYIDKAVEWYLGDDITFFSNTTDYQNGQWMDGIGAEVFSQSRLRWLDHKLQSIYDKSYREHPHKYFYEKSVASVILKPGGEDTAIRLDVNTQADYDFIAKLYAQFGHNRFTSQEVLHATQERVQS